MAKKRYGGRPRPWTTDELKLLRDSDLTVEELAERLGRTSGSVKAAAFRNRISLRRASRRGLVIGQPRLGRFPRAVREAMLEPRIDASVIAKRVKDDFLNPPELCPTCTYRPVRTKGGECLVCHRRRLTAAAMETLDELEALREWDTARQRLKRARERRKRSEE